MNCRDKLRFAGGDSVYYKPPPGVVERIETNAIRVFPCAVALLFVPTLKPDQFIHGVFSNTFWAACISTAVAARVVCGPRLIFPLGPTEIGRDWTWGVFIYSPVALSKWGFPTRSRLV